MTSERLQVVGFVRFGQDIEAVDGDDQPLEADHLPVAIAHRECFDRKLYTEFHRLSRADLFDAGRCVGRRGTDSAECRDERHVEIANVAVTVVADRHIELGSAGSINVLDLCNLHDF